MQYRKFGNTGIEISALGFGAMRLPQYEENGKWFVDEEKSIAMFHKAFEQGVNYVDTAYGYCHGNSEITVGKALKGWRDKVFLSTKLPLWHVKETSDYRRLLEEQLKKLDTDHIDFYHFHGASQQRLDDTILRFNLIDEMVKAKQEGLIRHISFSFHDAPAVMKTLIDTGAFESVLCQYNLLDRANEEMLAYAHSKGIGTVVMGPVGGGRLGTPSEVLKTALGRNSTSTPEVAMRFVLSNEHVSCALSGMSLMEQVDQNLEVASRAGGLTGSEKEAIDRMFEENRKLADLYCTGCDYCQPCPQNIKIPHVFSLMNYHRVYGLSEYARDEYSKLGPDSENGATPDACSECGQCEEKCPQHIPVREKLKETVAALGGGQHS
jgi:predicted aldo/keto reductase-like oxidoreductase